MNISGGVTSGANLFTLLTFHVNYYLIIIFKGDVN